MYRLSTILTTLFLLVSLSAVAQDEDSSPRWAIDGQVGGNITSKASSPASGVPRLRALSTSCTGLVTKLHVEYYLPKTNFSLKAGYEHEELTFLKGDASADLSQLMLGERWYPAPGDWPVVPYLGMDVLWAYNCDRGDFSMNASVSPGYSKVDKQYSYEAKGTVREPRFSVGPMAGVDVRLFSSIVLQVEYGYRFGLASPYHVRYTEGGTGKESSYHGQLHRHVLTIGLKLTFPFKWTKGDTRGLLWNLFY